MGVLRNERGFTMMIVLMAVLIMAVAGAAALTVTAGDTLSSAARANRAHAVAAAETGMTTFMRTAQVSLITNQWAAGNVPPAAGVVPFITIAQIDTDGDGTIDLISQYRVWGGAGGSPLPNSANLVSEGRVVDDQGNVLGTALIGSTAFRCGGPPVGTAQESLGQGAAGNSGFGNEWSCNYRGGAAVSLGSFN